MYQAKTTGFLELLMNALFPSASRRSYAVRRGRTLPTRREAALSLAQRKAEQRKETYIATARLLWWNR